MWFGSKRRKLKLRDQAELDRRNAEVERLLRMERDRRRFADAQERYVKGDITFDQLWVQWKPIVSRMAPSTWAVRELLRQAIRLEALRNANANMNNNEEEEK